MFGKQFILIAALAGLIIGCGSEKEGEKASGKIRIVATTGMVADVVKNVGGDRLEVTALMGPGVDPHLYKASAGDVQRMLDADLICYNGLHLEGKLTEVLEQAQKRGVAVLAAAEGIDRSRLLAHAEYEDAHDPHVWFDVTLWMEVVETVRDRLIELDRTEEGRYRERSQAYLNLLKKLDGEVRVELEKVPKEQRVLITAHDAFNYFGRAYGFEVRGLQGISTATEAGTADVQALSTFIAEKKIAALFVESSVPRRSIEAVQAAVKAKGFDVKIGDSLFSDAMGDPGTEEGTYLGMVRHNVRAIVQGLER